MSVNLKKNNSINLTKESDNQGKIMVGLGWDVNGNGTQDFDLDASVATFKNKKGLFGTNRLVLDDLVYYGNKMYKGSHDDIIYHHGDNLTGQGDGDDEQIMINLDKIPDDVVKITVIINIYSAYLRRQRFDDVKNCFARIFNSSGEICRYDIDGEYQGDTGMIVGEFDRIGKEWKFKAIGTGVRDHSVQDTANKLYK